MQIVTLPKRGGTTLMLSTLHQRRVPDTNRQCYFGATWKAPAPSTMGASAQWSPGQHGAGKCMEPRLTKSSSVSWSPGLKRVTDLDRQVHTPLAKSSSVPWSPGLKQVTDLDRAYTEEEGTVAMARCEGLR